MKRPAEGLTRRNVLAGTSALALVGACATRTAGSGARLDWAAPVSPSSVTLKPSIFTRAIAANRDYLLMLEPDRLLHNFLKGADLEPKAPKYGGWEGASIAGHSLGHWLTATSTIIANTGDPELRARLDYTVSELARAQDAHGDGYLAASTTWEPPNGEVNGKAAYERLRRGEIENDGFSLNGCWVPVYSWHKVHAGLLDAWRLGGNTQAREVALKLADYFATIIEGLSDEQVQKMLATEHGGINDAYAETYALTGDERWLRVARRLCHRAVLDPLKNGVDQLQGLHANTQIPKVTGLARIYETGGDEDARRAARFFHRVVTEDHSYVIGGNSDRENFGAPDQVSGFITETTCESCNTYNMLKLTRHLYAWRPDARWFDYYERAHLNHIMAHQEPEGGRFVYFMPMAPGARRTYSTYFDSFWCCVGSGMESHAKHHDSIYWEAGPTLFINLYYASSLDQPDGFALEMDTAFPDNGKVSIRIDRAPDTMPELALRIPAWAKSHTLTLNGRAVSAPIRDGYAVLTGLSAGDEIALDLSMTPYIEAAPDDPNLISVLSGPLVLAADLGPADRPFASASPALVTDGDPLALLTTDTSAPHTYTLPSATGETLTLRPYFNQYHRRTALYFPVFTAARWAAEGAAYMAAEAARIDLAARTVDSLYLGEQQPEVDHAVDPGSTEFARNFEGRAGRRLRSGDVLTARMERRAGPTTLRVSYQPQERGGALSIMTDDVEVAREDRLKSPPSEDISFDYTLPDTGATGPFTLRLEGLSGEVVVYDLHVISEATG